MMPCRWIQGLAVVDGQETPNKSHVSFLFFFSTQSNRIHPISLKKHAPLPDDTFFEQRAHAAGNALLHVALEWRVIRIDAADEKVHDGVGDLRVPLSRAFHQQHGGFDKHDIVARREKEPVKDQGQLDTGCNGLALIGKSKDICAGRNELSFTLIPRRILPMTT